MIASIVHHYAQPGKVKEAQELVREYGRLLRGCRGFLGRHTMSSQSDPLKITSMTVWQRKEDYEAWRDSPDSQRIRQVVSKLWSKPPEPEFFDIVPEL